jgi:hypothetical protein
MATHQPWPYPRTREQVVHVVMVSLAAVLVALVGLAGLAAHYRDKPLTADALKQAAASLGSYASEAESLTGQAAASRSTQHYQRGYLQQLSDQSAQVTGFVQSHAPVPADHLGITQQSVIRYGQQLQQQLLIAHGQAAPGDLKQSQRILHRLREQFTGLEAGL